VPARSHVVRDPPGAPKAQNEFKAPDQANAQSAAFFAVADVSGLHRLTAVVYDHPRQIHAKPLERRHG